MHSAYLPFGRHNKQGYAQFKYTFLFLSLSSELWNGLQITFGKDVQTRALNYEDDIRLVTNAGDTPFEIYSCMNHNLQVRRWGDGVEVTDIK